MAARKPRRPTAKKASARTKPTRKRKSRRSVASRRASSRADADSRKRRPKLRKSTKKASKKRVAKAAAKTRKVVKSTRRAKTATKRPATKLKKRASAKSTRRPKRARVSKAVRKSKQTRATKSSRARKLKLKRSTPRPRPKAKPVRRKSPARKRLKKKLKARLKPRLKARRVVKRAKPRKKLARRAVRPTKRTRTAARTPVRATKKRKIPARKARVAPKSVETKTPVSKPTKAISRPVKVLKPSKDLRTDKPKSEKQAPAGLKAAAALAQPATRDRNKNKSTHGTPPPHPQRPGRNGEHSSATAKAIGSQPPALHPRPPLVRPLMLPVVTEAPPLPLEERAASVEARLGSQPESIQKDYIDRLYMSWIHHDSALEGVVYTFQELQMAVDPAITVVPDSTIQPICEEIRRHKSAIDFVRDAARKKQSLTADVIKRIYLLLHPEEGDLKTVKYRKDIPQHRLYFHEYATPDKIAYAVRQAVEWVNDPETRRTRTAVRIAARAHYDLLRAFPFPVDSGKVSRLAMNFILLRAGFPPAIIHSTERQRYYEALRGSPLAIVHMVQEALENSIASIEKFLDEHASRLRPPGS